MVSGGNTVRGPRFGPLCRFWCSTLCTSKEQVLRKLVINVDLDGVVYDFDHVMRALGGYYLERELPVSRSWNMWECWDVTMEEWLEMFHRAAKEDELFYVGREIEGGPAGVRQLLSAGHRVRFVSHKNLADPDAAAAAMIQTVRWLNRQDLLTGTEIVFTGDKQGYKADVVIDDKTSLEWAQAGALNLLFDQPWNWYAEPESRLIGEPPVRRVHGWDDVLETVDWLARAEAQIEFRA